MNQIIVSPNHKKYKNLFINGLNTSSHDRNDTIRIIPFFR